MQGFLPPAGRGPGADHQPERGVAARARRWRCRCSTREVAAGFLVNRTGDPDERAATELAGELGGLPLALEQAAAYIQATGTTLAGYLSMFRDRRADLLARGEAAGHPADVAATLGLALSRLGDEAPAAAGLVRLLACLAPEPVPLALLLAGAQVAGELAPDVAATVGPLLGDPVAAGDAVAALRRYSLVTPAGDGLVLVHRLVQAVTLAQLSADVAGQWEQAAAALVEAAIPADTELPAAWPVCAVLLPHARAVLDLTSDGMWRIAHYLGYSGSYPAARDLFQLITDAYRDDDAYGAEHPDTLTARASLAFWTGQAGDAAGARDQSPRCCPSRSGSWAPSTAETLTTRANLARWTGEAGDAAGARDQLAALLPIRERVLGAEHPHTLITRANLAYWTGEAGDAAGARDQYAALLPISRAGPGPRAPGHPDHPRQPRLLDRGGGGCGRGPRPVRRAAAHPRAGPGPRAPGHPGHPRQPRPLDRGGGGCGRGPRPVRRAAAHPRAGPGPRAPGHPGRPRQPGLLDRAGGGRGRGPRPVRRAAAHPRAGPRRRAPGHPERPRQPRPLDQAEPKMTRG